VADHEFFFSIELPGRPASLGVLRELAPRVLGQFGCGGDAVPALVDALETAVARGAESGAFTCRLQFVARDGRLDIAVSSDGGPPWRTSHAISAV